MVNPPPFDLADRTFSFATDVRIFIGQLPYALGLREDAVQLIRSSGSLGANYIEANEAISVKDRLFRIKICRKEARESIYWLRLLRLRVREQQVDTWKGLMSEAEQLLRIFSSIVLKHDRMNA